jgi:hypothetical protein
MLARPSLPFTIIMAEGYGVDVLHPELISVEYGVQFAVVYDPPGIVFT